MGTAQLPLPLLLLLLLLLLPPLLLLLPLLPRGITLGDHRILFKRAP